MSSSDTRTPAETERDRKRHSEYVMDKRSEFCCKVLTVGAEAQRRSAARNEDLGSPEVPPEQAPEPMRFSVMTIPMTNSNFAPNADTIRTTFKQDVNNTKMEPAKFAFGTAIDTANSYAWTRAGVTVKDIGGKYSDPISKEATLKLGLMSGTHETCMEAIRLPRDVLGEHFDDFVRIHILAIQSNANKSDSMDCVPMHLMFAHRAEVVKSLMSDAKKNNQHRSEVVRHLKMKMGANDTFVHWKQNLPMFLDRMNIPHRHSMDPKRQMGNFHPESVWNPRSRVDEMEDREYLKNTLPEENKDAVLRMRQQVIDEANNPDLYLHRCDTGDGPVGEVFRMPHMENCYPLPSSLWGNMSLPSQQIGDQLTPKGLEDDAPSHAVVRNKCFIKLHHRSAN